LISIPKLPLFAVFDNLLGVLHASVITCTVSLAMARSREDKSARFNTVLREPLLPVFVGWMGFRGAASTLVAITVAWRT
jgi:hypothetical protein